MQAPGCTHSSMTDEEDVHEDSSPISCQPSDGAVDEPRAVSLSTRPGHIRRRRRNRDSSSRPQRHLAGQDGDSTDDEMMFFDEALRRLSAVSLEDVQCCRFNRRPPNPRHEDHDASEDWIEEIMEDDAEEVMWDVGTALRRLSTDITTSLIPSMGSAANPDKSSETSNLVICRPECVARPANPDHAPLTLLKQTLSVCGDSDKLRRSSRVDVKSFSLELDGKPRLNL